MALATGGRQIVLVNSRARIGRREDFVEAVATAAIGRAGRTVLRGQPVITGEERLHPVGGQVVFGIEPLRSVALAAHVLGNGQSRTVFEPLDSMFRMAAGASGRVAPAAGQRLAVNALDDIAGLFFVTLAAGAGQVGEMERRGGQRRRQNIVRAVAINALRRGMFAVTDMVNAGVAMHAQSVGERLFFMAERAIDRPGGHVVIRMFGRQVRMATGAGSFLMRRAGQHRGIHEQRLDHAGGVGGGQCFVAMTIQTIAVFDVGRHQGRCPQQSRGEGYKRADVHAGNVADGGVNCLSLLGFYFAIFAQSRSPWRRSPPAQLHFCVTFHALPVQSFIMAGSPGILCRSSD